MAIQLVTPPTIDQTIKADIIRILKDALVDAEAGEISSIMVIFECTDGRWGQENSGTPSMTQTVGRLEIAKAKMNTGYLMDDERP